MWIKWILLGVVGTGAGLAVSAGVFAFFVSLGIVPRMATKTQTASSTMLYENAIVYGGIMGNLYSIFLSWRIPLGSGLLGVYGICAGIYTGCVAIALAEVLNAFPIMFHRIRLKHGLVWIITCMAIGKTVGSWYFFWKHMAM